MTTVVAQEPVTQAVIDALTAQGLRVGDGEEPDGVGWQGPPGASAFLSYVVVFPLPGGTRFGTLDDHEADATLLYQATCVGAARQACERVLDRCSAAMTREGLNAHLAGRRITLVRHDFGSAQVRRDDEPEPGAPRLWYATPRWRLWTTPV